LGGIQAGLEDLAVGIADEDAEFRDGLEVIAAAAGNPHLADGAPGSELAGAGADAGLADAELIGDLLERQGRG